MEFGGLVGLRNHFDVMREKRDRDFPNGAKERAEKWPLFRDMPRKLDSVDEKCSLFQVDSDLLGSFRHVAPGLSLCFLWEICDRAFEATRQGRPGAVGWKSTPAGWVQRRYGVMAAICRAISS